MPKLIGIKILLARKELKMNQSELGKIIGVEPNTIYHFLVTKR
jgi:DNA-binding XRE family transcriptional regulator